MFFIKIYTKENETKNVEEEIDEFEIPIKK